ncbi:hypothetical protein SAMN04487765_3681 [Tenacibaculum sp. MAR_2010_89]|uniref:hypothetical protein n=1 Tax=Tenacibaculum sp. MAR_2010_89 TaxID=1250198 RepID=UPI0008990708|nr:hypothetical protein [Tenacibaculum sp. MAR_2010_89]SEE66479.1 hypothetical protein SAMN04487765_3681 [Tenacibaculum sp. MAR_2010_89]
MNSIKVSDLIIKNNRIDLFESFVNRFHDKVNQGTCLDSFCKSTGLKKLEILKVLSEAGYEVDEILLFGLSDAQIKFLSKHFIKSLKFLYRSTHNNTSRHSLERINELKFFFSQFEKDKEEQEQEQVTPLTSLVKALSKVLGLLENDLDDFKIEAFYYDLVNKIKFSKYSIGLESLENLHSYFNIEFDENLFSLFDTIKNKLRIRIKIKTVYDFIECNFLFFIKSFRYYIFTDEEDILRNFSIEKVS